MTENEAQRRWEAFKGEHPEAAMTQASSPFRCWIKFRHKLVTLESLGEGDSYLEAQEKALAQAGTDMQNYDSTHVNSSYS